MAACRHCGARITFETTRAGKLMPTDPDGQSHFGTCPARPRKPEPPRDVCTRCGSLSVVQGPGAGPHYGRLTCQDCRAVRWLRRPSEAGLMYELLDHIVDKIAFEPNTGCWLWTAYIDDKGYGRLMLARHSWRAHRFVYRCLAGNGADGLHLDHQCNVRHCVNPAHLRPATPRENTLAPHSMTLAAQQLRRTHCPRGHAYSADNTYVIKGHRQCRTCRRIDNRERNRRWRQTDAGREYHRAWKLAHRGAQ